MEKGVVKTVEKVVKQRAEVLVDRVVYRDVIKEVEKIVEVPVEKVVIKEVSVPVPMKTAKEKPTPEAEPSPSDFIRNGMTKSDVAAVLGSPASTLEEAEKILWFYEECGQGVALADGNAALALVNAQSALAVEPNSALIKELIRELLAKISAQTPPR